MSEKTVVNVQDNIGSIVRLGLGWLGGYLAGKGINLDIAGLEQLILLAIPLATAAWSWWHNRKGVTGILSH